jgi:hypothetical protein
VCPATPADRGGDLSRFGFVGTAWGSGPAYPGTPSAASDHLVIEFTYPPPASSIVYGSDWSGQKVNWIVDPDRRPSVFLIRGRQLDGSVELRFGLGLHPPALMWLNGPGDHPSTTRLRASGCYAYQIDSFKFSKLIVFEARTVQ